MNVIATPVRLAIRVALLLALAAVGGSPACKSGVTTADTTCEILQETVATGTTYTVQVLGAAAADTLFVRITSSDGTESKTVLTNHDGEASLDVFASTAGTSVIEIVRDLGNGGVVVATCVAHVGDQSGCGDAVCAATETCEECADDCGACAATCGDGTCDTGESCSTCADDCGTCQEVCGDGTCNLSESCLICSQDCGACAGATCGDGACDSGENCTSCAADCGACPASCGDGNCDAGEDCTACPGDCGVCPPSCGDLLCNGNETCTSCAGDCGSCAQTCEPAATALPNGRHKAGRACLDCHSRDFSIAGTAYVDATGSAPSVGATLVITDANGNEHKLISASNGNFYTSGRIPLPATAVGTRCPTLHQMNDQVVDGNCNACHKSGNRIYIE